MHFWHAKCIGMKWNPSIIAWIIVIVINLLGPKPKSMIAFHHVIFWSSCIRPGLKPTMEILSSMQCTNNNNSTVETEGHLEGQKTLEQKSSWCSHSHLWIMDRNKWHGKKEYKPQRWGALVLLRRFHPLTWRICTNKLRSWIVKIQFHSAFNSNLISRSY